MARQYKMTKRMEKAYANYVKLYEAKEASLRKRGFEMAAPKLNFNSYRMVRQATIEEGVKTNINKTIVSEEAFVYSQKTAKHMRSAAREYNLDWKDLSIADIRSSKADVQNRIDKTISQIYENLKEEHPELSTKAIGKYISYEVFGSE